MDKIGVLAAILLILAVSGVSDASVRVLIADGKGEQPLVSENVFLSPTPGPSPITVGDNSNSEPSHKPSQPPPPPKPTQFPPVTNASNTTSPNMPPHPPMESSPADSAAPVAPESKIPPGPSGRENTTNDKDKKEGKNPKSESLPKPESPEDKIQKEICDASAQTCHDEKNLVACLQHPGDDSKNFVLLIQNTGENTLSVKIKATPSVYIDMKKQRLAKRSFKKIKISVSGTNSTQIVLNAGTGNCVLHIGQPFSYWNPFEQFPAYANHLTPIYGAYFLFCTIVIVGGTWACCKFRKQGRRTDAGIPYQQLEMGTQPRSPSAIMDSNGTDGWDEGWDNDWDDEEAVAKPSEKHTASSVSSNGLISRTPKKDTKDGWDVDWDD